MIVAELSHAEDVVRLASLPYVSNENLHYDNWLGPTSFEYGLSDTLGVGDLRAYNLDPAGDDWAGHVWRGFRAQLYRGEPDMAVSQMTKIATAHINDFRQIGDDEFVWDVVTDAQIYNRTFHSGADTTETRTVAGALDWLISQIDNRGSYDFLNVPAALRNKPLGFTVTESTSMIDLIAQVVRSIGADYRITHTGYLEILMPDRDSPPVRNIDISSIVDRVEHIGSINAVNRVVVTYDQGNQRVSAPTEAETGSLDEEVVIDTLLPTAADAQALADEQAVLYSDTRKSWDVKFIDDMGHNTIQPGDMISIDHPTVRGTGVVDQTKMTPPSFIDQTEVII